MKTKLPLGVGVLATLLALAYWRQQSPVNPPLNTEVNISPQMKPARLSPSPQNASTAQIAFTVASNQTPSPAIAGTIPQLQILQDKSQPLQDRVKAAEQLGKSRNPEALTPFITILTNANEHALLRCFAARGLGSLADERAVEFLGTVLKNPSNDTNLRAASALALGGIKTENAVAALVTAKDDADDLVRFKVIQGLERTGQPSAISYATDALTDPDVYTRARAVHALGTLGATSTLPAIKALLENDQTDNFTRIACLTSLGNLGGKEATEILQKYQNDQNKLLRINAGKALQRIREKETQ